MNWPLGSPVYQAYVNVTDTCVDWLDASQTVSPNLGETFVVVPLTHFLLLHFHMIALSTFLQWTDLLVAVVLVS